MTLNTVLAFAHQVMKAAIKEGDTAVDATCGNGHDTQFLSNLVGETGYVYGFDIQDAAIASTKAKLTEQQFNRVTLIHDSHKEVSRYIKPEHTRLLKGAIFNLGYLPGSDKTVVTTPTSTLTALEHLLELLQPEGVVVLVVYHGHAGGSEEKDQLLDYVQTLNQQSFHVLQYAFINQKNTPPFVIAIEKRK
ncbi:rRNA methyltransferase [Thalassobacillus devorans]|uniref:rRNA methyltransferase n=1 Tax=Thalassobacillus devorans TaxID=279813 RepID=A0ABQ1NNW7_9BACI|nr:class I SAM-dependent methyltransferase [Thalassobacillus devorans]NIK29118.1 putative methyltransferase [Thalassobacillus devorans]GGC81018.1 rRNA methyltransferase [Thalassobacillus devorans]